MKSGKQKRAEIHAKRKKKSIRRQKEQEKERRLRSPPGPRVNEALLAPYNSYGAPDFVFRGYYVDRPFHCVDCGKEEVWTCAQQKWWYEVAKGYPYSSAIRCRFCRRKERQRRDQARRVHLAGLELKAWQKRGGSRE